MIMTLTPHQKELMEIVVEVIQDDPKLCHLLQHAMMKGRFARINGLERESCQK